MVLRDVFPEAPVERILACSGISEWQGQDKAPSAAHETNAMLSFRVFANRIAAHQPEMNEKQTMVFRSVGGLWHKITSKHGKHALATLYLNATCHTAHLNSDVAMTMTTTLIGWIGTEQESETLYRCLTALGNLIVGSVPCKHTAHAMALSQQLAHITSHDPRIQHIKTELVHAL